MADDQEQLNAERVTAPLELPKAGEGFKVKLQPTHTKPEDAVKDFAYNAGGEAAQWSLDRDGYVIEFFGLETVRSFIAAAIATGGLALAKDSPTSLQTKFKVKLTRKPGSPDERITLFSFVDGDRLDHFDASSGDEFEKEFDDLNKAHGFITAALGTGGFAVAADSPVKLSE